MRKPVHHDGITYLDTYFIKRTRASDEARHFHGLVHAIQWRALGPERFVRTYADGVERFGYRNSPLERTRSPPQAGRGSQIAARGRRSSTVPSGSALWRRRSARREPWLGCSSEGPQGAHYESIGAAVSQLARRANPTEGGWGA